MADPVKIEIERDLENGHVVHLWLPSKGWRKIKGSEHKRWVAKNRDELAFVFQQILELMSFGE